ncbi:MAG: hypothetical protein AAGA18_14260, partial [Verrucomicrobiota bacterium]
GSYTITRSGNDIDTLAGNTGTITLSETDGLAIGATTASNTLDVTSTGAITNTGAINVTNAATFKTTNDTGQDITLTNVGNTFGSISAQSRNTADSANASGNIAIQEIGTADIALINTTGNFSFTADNTVTQSGAITAAGVELLGASGAFTLTNTANAITTLAGNTGSVSFLENSGFDIGTVNTVGLTTSGNLTLSSTGSVTQSQALSAAGLELLGAGGAFTLTNTGNAITTLAGNTGSLSFLENSGFDIGTVNTTGLTTSGNLTLSSTGSVTQSQALSAAGLELTGSGAKTLENASNDVNTIAVSGGETSFRDTDDLAVGSVGSTNGINVGANDVSLETGGALTQTQAIAATGLVLKGSGAKTLTNAGNDITTIAGSGGSLSYTDTNDLAIGSLTVNGSTTTGLNIGSNDLTFTTSGNVTQSEAITVGGLNLLGNGTFTLNHTSNAITTLGNVTRGGAFSLFDSAGGLIIDGNIGGTTTNDVLIRTVGDLTLASGTTITTTGGGNDITLEAASGSFINNAGAGALSSASRFLVYSLDNSAPHNKGGLTGTEQFSVSFGADPLGTGNVFYYSASSSGGGSGGSSSGSGESELSSQASDFIVQSNSVPIVSVAGVIIQSGVYGVVELENGQKIFAINGQETERSLETIFQEQSLERPPRVAFKSGVGQKLISLKPTRANAGIIVQDTKQKNVSYSLVGSKPIRTHIKPSASATYDDPIASSGKSAAIGKSMFLEKMLRNLLSNKDIRKTEPQSSRDQPMGKSEIIQRMEPLPSKASEEEKELFIIEKKEAQLETKTNSEENPKKIKLEEKTLKSTLTKL